MDPNIYWLFYVSTEDLVLPSHYTEIVNCCGMICGVTLVIDMGRGPEMNLNLSPYILGESPIYALSYSNLSHLNLYITSLFLVIWYSSLGTTRWFLMVFSPMKNTCNRWFLQAFLKLSLRPLVYCTIMYVFYVVTWGTEAGGGRITFNVRLSSPSLHYEIYIIHGNMIIL